MKKLLLLSLIFTAFSAHAASTTDYLKCLRKVGKQRKVSDESIVSLLDSISSYNRENTDALLHDCQEVLSNSKQNPRRSTQTLFEVISDYKGNHDASWLMREMLGYYMNCTTYGVNAQVGLYGAVGAGYSVGLCTVSNGRIVSIMAPSLSYGIGIGATLSFIERDFPVAQDGNRIPTDLAYHWAIFAGETNGDDTSGYTLGLGAGVLLDHIIPIKLFPVGNDFSKQIGLLEKIATKHTTAGDRLIP